jgi:hypothetical protein
MHKINNEIALHKKDHMLFIGFNIFPKDYRQKLNLPMQHLSIDTGKHKFFNKIMVDIPNKNYSSNQIKYYLDTYADKIIKGTFPINLLKTDYLSSKYDKFTSYYDKQGYSFVPQDDIFRAITDLDKQSLKRTEIKHKTVYIPSLFKATDIIPVNKRTPVEGFLDRDNAIVHIKNKLKRPSPVYIYKANPDQFHVIDGKLIATQPIKIIEEESMLLSVN